jgi:hypothetical protein
MPAVSTRSSTVTHSTGSPAAAVSDQPASSEAMSGTASPAGTCSVAGPHRSEHANRWHVTLSSPLRATLDRSSENTRGTGSAAWTVTVGSMLAASNVNRPLLAPTSSTVAPGATSRRKVRIVVGSQPSTPRRQNSIDAIRSSPSLAMRITGPPVPPGRTSTTPTTGTCISVSWLRYGASGLMARVRHRLTLGRRRSRVTAAPSYPAAAATQLSSLTPMIDVAQTINAVRRQVGSRTLGLHLASGEAVNRADFAAWSASDEGRQFVTMSSQAWCDASVAAGTDPAAAAQAAARTTAAYTGEAPTS